jgi:3-methyladenine DNA glycosylase AlkD
MIYGFVIAYSKDIKIVDKYLDKYISLIDNWSLCDSFSSSLKILKKYDYFNKAKDLSLSNKEYQIRVGLTIILFQYINENNLKEIFNILDNLKLDTYYVNMAASWLLCDLFIKYRNDTLEYIKHTKVNDFIFNKFISKCRDSFRVSKKDKDFLKTLKK